MGDLVEQLFDCGSNAEGAEKLCVKAAEEITRLRAALADAQAVGFASGVEAAAKELRATVDDCCIADDQGRIVDFMYDEFTSGSFAAIRALTPPDATAAAARVLLGDENALRKLTFAYDREDAAQRGEPNPHTFIDLDAPDMGASWVKERISCAVSALLAIAGDTP